LRCSTYPFAIKVIVQTIIAPLFAGRIPGRVVRVRPEGGPLEHGRLPDPEGQAIDDLARRVAELEETVQRLAAERTVGR